MKKRKQRVLVTTASVVAAILVLVVPTRFTARAAGSGPTTTPIEHLVVIFQENVSFDHYFATYPNAANNVPGEPAFQAKPNTPNVNGLSGSLLTNNPNKNNPANLTNAINPFRLNRSQADLRPGPQLRPRANGV